MPNFPGGLDVFTSKTDGIDKYLAADINAVQSAAAALQQGGVSQQTVTEAVLVSGVDPTLGLTVFVTLTANRVVGAPLNPAAGRRLHFVFTEDGTGGRTLTFNAVFSITNWALNTAANARTEMTVEYDATASKWVVASNPSYAQPPFGMVYNVKHPRYGALVNGTADDTIAVQLALTDANTAGAAGSIVFIPSGTCLINTVTANTGLSVGSNTILCGAGKNATILLQGFANNGQGNNWLLGNADTVNGNGFITLCDMTIQTPATVGVSPNLTSYGEAWYFQGVSDLLVQNVRVLYGAGTMRPLPAVVNTATVHSTGKNNRCKVLACDFSQGAEAFAFLQGTDLIAQGNYGVNIYDSTLSINSSGERISIGGNIFDGQANTFAAIALIELTNDQAGDAAGIRVFTIAGNILLGHATYATRGVSLGRCSQGSVSGNIVRNLPGVGIFLGGLNTTVTVNGNTVVGCLGQAVQLTNDAASTAITFSGNTITGNTGNGIYCGGAATTLVAITITGNTCQNNGGYGINVSGANVTAGLVMGNTVTGNSAGQISLGSSTGWTIRINPGFVTEAHGTATVGAGATTVVVNHGLQLTPTLEQISLTPQGDWLAAAGWWISTPTSTQFTINTKVAPGGAGLAFGWKGDVGY